MNMRILLLSVGAFLLSPAISYAGMNWASLAGNCWRPVSMDVGQGSSPSVKIAMFASQKSQCSEAKREILDKITFWSIECCWPVEVVKGIPTCPSNGQDMVNQNIDITMALVNLNGKATPSDNDCAQDQASGGYKAVGSAVCYNGKQPSTPDSHLPASYQFSQADYNRCGQGKSKKYP